MTFGFQSAADIATHAIDCIHTTAASHGRVFIVEVMGHIRDICSGVAHPVHTTVFWQRDWVPLLRI